MNAVRNPEAMDRLNQMSDPEAQFTFLRVCGSERWAKEMVACRPYLDEEHVYETAYQVWKTLDPKDWREAFTHHPRIGANIEVLREKFKNTATWSSQEQRGVQGASEQTLRALAQGNEEYEKKFGFVFLICATGKSANEMLAALRQRLKNTPEQEFQNAIDEQAKIIRIRLEKLFA